MAGKPDTQTVCGVEIPAEQRTPLVEALLRVIEQQQVAIHQQQLRIEQLEEEVRRLKGLPDKPKRKPKPSPLNDPSGPPSASGEKKKPNTPDGKRPGSAKRSKTQNLVIHENVPLSLSSLPAGSEFLGYQDFTIQDLLVESHNTRYRRGRYRLPDGRIVIAPLPQHVASHFGPTLRQYVLYQHFHNHVTQPLLHGKRPLNGVLAEVVAWSRSHGIVPGVRQCPVNMARRGMRTKSGFGGDASPDGAAAVSRSVNVAAVRRFPNRRSMLGDANSQGARQVSGSLAPPLHVDQKKRRNRPPSCRYTSLPRGRPVAPSRLFCHAAGACVCDPASIASPWKRCSICWSGGHAEHPRNNSFSCSVTFCVGDSLCR